MQLNGMLSTFPKEIKMLITAFIIVLSIGFYTGLLFVSETSSVHPNGIEEQYLGNEADEDALIMKFKKSEQEMLTLVHGHILSMSIIFFLVGVILCTTKLPQKIKIILIVEPFASVLFTFGGLYFLWKNILWMKYIVMISGSLMTLSFTISVVVILYQLFVPRKIVQYK
ncbi:hypothetical protein A9Q86_03380 [Flavobacteriales bacterium 33_180_T64]|nr:hypothetical protein A9Q86_03380 [Flavobacteriales bacterium 33_180_T64]